MLKELFGNPMVFFVYNLFTDVDNLKHVFTLCTNMFYRCYQLLFNKLYQQNFIFKNTYLFGFFFKFLILHHVEIEVDNGFFLGQECG